MRGIFITYEEGTLEPARVKSGLRLSMLCGCLAYIWLSIAVGMPLTMFMEAAGASGMQIGLIVFAQQLPLILQIPSALLSERASSRKLNWFIFAMVHRSLWLLPAVLAFFMGVPSQALVWMLIGTVAISSCMAQLSAPLWQSWMADLVPREAGASFWGFRQAVVTAVFVLANCIAGVLLDTFKGTGSLTGFGIVFAFAAVAGTLDIVMHTFVPEPKGRAMPVGMGSLEKIKESLKQRDFIWMTVAVGIWFFGMALLGAFGPVCLKHEFGLDYKHISIYIAAGSVGTLLASIPLGRLGDKFGARTICALIMLLAPLILVSWFFVGEGEVELLLPLIGPVKTPNAMAIILIPQFLAGALYSGVGLCQMHLLGTLSKKEGRIVSMALHWTFIGIMSCLGPLLGGAVMDYFSKSGISITLPMGARMNFYHVLVIIHILVAWAGGLCMLKVRTRGDDLSMADVFRLLRSDNPFRAVMASYLQILSPRVSNDDGED